MPLLRRRRLTLRQAAARYLAARRREAYAARALSRTPTSWIVFAHTHTHTFLFLHLAERCRLSRVKWIPEIVYGLSARVVRLRWACRRQRHCYCRAHRIDVRAPTSTRKTCCLCVCACYLARAIDVGRAQAALFARKLSIGRPERRFTKQFPAAFVRVGQQQRERGKNARCTTRALTK